MSTGEQFDIISSTRTWRFAMDDIRLSSMANARFAAFVTDAFGFDDSAGADLMFEDYELKTYPPPMVFRSGLAPIEIPAQDAGDVEEVAVRRLAISATQISIEVAGPTAFAVAAYDFFRYLISDARTPDGKPFVGEPIATKDSSLIVVRRPAWTTASLLDDRVRELLSESFHAPTGHEFVPAIELSAYSVIDPSNPPRRDLSGWRLSLRFGTTPADHCFQSMAGMSSDDHVAFLDDLSTKLH